MLPIRSVGVGVGGPSLIGVLGRTGRLQLAFGALHRGPRPQIV